VIISLLLERALHFGELFLQAAALHHLRRKLVVKTYANRTSTMSKHQAVDPTKKVNEANQGVTVHLLLEFVHLLALLDRLGLQGLNPCPVLTDLHGEPDRHILGLGL
jgi:hypothetical protein